MSNHTQGNWMQVGQCIESQHGAVVAWCRESAIFGKYGDYSITAKEAIENARLIAAAPELLEALKSIVEFWDANVPTDCLSEQHKTARVAITKATQGEMK